jgi:hypothetical protein
MRWLATMTGRKQTGPTKIRRSRINASALRVGDIVIPGDMIFKHGHSMVLMLLVQALGSIPRMTMPYPVFSG